MEETENKRTIKYSVQLQFGAIFAVIMLGLLVFLNTYPVLKLRDTVFLSKYSSMQSQASVISSSLSALEYLSAESVSAAMSVMGVSDKMGVNQVIITDESGKIIYDASGSDARLGKYALYSEVNQALSGNMVFYSDYGDNVFESRSSMPVTNRGTLLGAVYLYEYDAEQGQIISTIQGYLRNITIIVGLCALALIFLSTRALTKRITQLVRTIRIVSEGEYEYRMPVKGSDELTELAQELNNLTERLQSTEEIRRRFVSDASHELKTPLASIRLLSESITQNPEIDRGTLIEFVGDIGNEAERLQRTTEKLLNLTRMDINPTLERQCVDLADVVRDTLRMIKPLAQQNEIEIHSTLDEGCTVYAIEDDLHQVVFNLVENSIKYNLPGGEVKVFLFVSEGLVNLCIDDTGIGIPEADLPHIFSRFYRVDKARSREAGGSGLGLSIVRDAVELHGGEIEALPVAGGRGTRFKVSFPVYGENGDGI